MEKAKLLKKGGKLVKFLGTLLKTKNPATCFCCNEPPPPNIRWACRNDLDLLPRCVKCVDWTQNPTEIPVVIDGDIRPCFAVTDSDFYLTEAECKARCLQKVTGWTCLSYGPEFPDFPPSCLSQEYVTPGGVLPPGVFASEAACNDVCKPGSVASDNPLP